MVISAIFPLAHIQATEIWVWTEQSAVGDHNWHALASSSDGSRLFAASESCGTSACPGGIIDVGGIWLSTDYGVTWTAVASTSGRRWFSLAANIDGSKVAAVDLGGDIYTSTDFGLTWTQRQVGGTVHNWTSIASSIDGSKLVAVAGDGFIFTSVDSGLNWTNYTPSGVTGFTGVSSSDDGSRLAASTWSDGIFVSSDFGHTWTRCTLTLPNPSNPAFLGHVSMSGDGAHLVTGSRPYNDNGGIVFTSKDYGATWSSSAQGPYDYIGFASSGDGSKVAAAIYGQSGVSTSENYGATWTFQRIGNKGVIPIETNIDGSLLFLGVHGGRLWTGIRVNVVSEAESQAALKAASDAAAARREAEKKAARIEITTRLKNSKDLTVDLFAMAEIPGVTATNIAFVQAEILALPEESQTDINQVLKIARRYEVVSKIGSDLVNYLQSNIFVEIELIAATSKHKVALVAAIRKLPETSRDTYEEIKSAIESTTASIQARKDRLAAVINRNSSRYTK